MSVWSNKPLVRDEVIWLVPGVIRGPQMVTGIQSLSDSSDCIIWTVHSDLNDNKNRSD